MRQAPLFDKLQLRLLSDKDEGDIAYFYALSSQLEYVTKLVVSGVVACLGDDADRNKYSIEYDLVRADSIGDWAGSLNSALTGPAAQFFIPSTTHIARDLTERVAEGDWRYEAVSLLSQVALSFGLDAKIGARVALRQCFEIGAAIRNRTRGHGAPTTEDCHAVCPALATALALISENHQLFRHDWAHLYRNLSGKYRVSPLLGMCSDFEFLKSEKDENIANGVYISLDGIRNVPFIFSAPGITDILVANGNYKAKEFELLSYISNDVERRDGSAWSIPPGRLPPSHTEGQNELNQLGNTFTNLPQAPSGHIKRERLENQLRDELVKLDRHPIITLTGPGGIGKTTLALATIDLLAKSSDCPYEVILWMSSRDVDLLDSGPKPVSPKVVTKLAIARVAVELLDPAERKSPGFDTQSFFERCLEHGAAGKTLVVLDNFETVESPADIFAWIDTYVRHPNKVLITTRFRDFHGDYPIEIGGMADSEARLLIDQEAKRLGIAELLTGDYKTQLIEESDGHPYVIKILLGQVAKERRAVKPERIIASADQLLVALFERTFEGLTPAAQRVFLLLSSWRAFVPSIAVEAVALRPENERFNVQGAIDELRRYSLIEEVVSDQEDEPFIGVPLAAASFGRRKLEVSPFKVAVEQDRKILMEFGAGSRDSSRHGVMPRIDKLVSVAANKASENPSAVEGFLPILEYVASRMPMAYLRIARLLAEVGGPGADQERIKAYLRRYLESPSPTEKEMVWFWLADLCHSTDDPIGEVHALGEVAMLPQTSPETIGIIANRINNKLREFKERGITDSWSDEVRQLVDRVAEVMRRHLNELDATDCSRLSWLYLNIGNAERARDVAVAGNRKDPNNEHCLKLIERVGP